MVSPLIRAPRSRPARRRPPPLAAALALALASGAGPASAAAAPTPQPTADPAARSEPAAVAVVETLRRRQASLPSYRGRVAVDFRLRSFPYVSQHLDGSTYFKRPDEREVVFDSVPPYAKGFDRLYADIDDPGAWLERFTVALDGTRVVDGHRDVLLRLVQKVRGMIDHESVAIDPERARVDAMEWHYYNGGEIAMTQVFAPVDGVSLVVAQHATIRIPFVHASADASYSAYRTNVAIDDSTFAREKK